MIRLPGFVLDWGRDILLNVMVSSPLLPRGLRWRALRACGLDVQRSAIGPSGYFGGRNVSIGAGAYINVGVFIDNTAHVSIGASCSIGPNASLLTGTHEIGSAEKRAGRDVGMPILIGDGCWLGAGVTVLPGVTLGKGVVIAAGAVVTRDCDSHALYAGVPARKMRSFSEPASSLTQAD